MEQANKKRRRKIAAAVAVLAMGCTTIAAYAATSQIIASGTLEYSPVTDGPATVTMRTLTLAPGEVLGWHHHDGDGAWTVVVSGTLTVEDGCGEVKTYAQGQAFKEAPNRIHRGKNLTDATVVTAQTFVMPQGHPISDAHSTPGCGVPVSVDECKYEGWRKFTFPTFTNQGECTEFVILNK